MQAQPSQLRIAYGADPCTQIRLTWQVAMPTESPQVEYGTTPQLGMRALAQRRTYSHETGVIYSALLTNLQPNTRYYYRVGSPQGGFSRAYTFHTPRRGPHDFVFTAFADHGTTPFSVRNTRNVLAHNPTFHFIAGDLSYANGRQPVWDLYERQLEVLTARVPTMVCLGNHENERVGNKRIGYRAALARFPMPDPDRYFYQFHLGNAFFVAFNSNEPDDTEQLRWLERTLQDAQRNRIYRWRIAFMHHPPYSSTARRGNNARIIQTFVPLLERYQVDLVIMGHNHNYERFYPMRGGQAVVRSGTRYPQGKGVVYVICGGGGVSLYDLMPKPTPTTAKRERTYCYLKVRVPASGALQVEAYRIDNSLIDRFEIV